MNCRKLKCNFFLNVLGSVPAVQVFPQPVFFSGGLFTVCTITENWLLIHLLGTAGEYRYLQTMSDLNPLLMQNSE